MDQHSFGLTLPALPASVSVVRHLFGGVRGVWPVTELQLHDIQIAVSEACTNVIQHAYDPKAPGMLEVHAAFDGDTILVHVRDNGPGMAPQPALEGLGVGLALIAALTTRVEIGHADGAHQVSMVFELDAGVEATP